MDKGEYKGLLIVFSPDDSNMTGFGWYAEKPFDKWERSQLFRSKNQLIHAIDTDQVIWKE